MDRDIKKLVSQMTLEEKASLCSGLDDWQTKPVARLGIPSVTMTDGPHGVRKKDAGAVKPSMYTSVPATCFPANVTTACSWDKNLLEKVGVALGEEFQAEGVTIQCGPGVNIKRSPLCGRNFEYFSEDPFLASELVTSYIKGVQSQGVGTALKHYAVNNQEQRRMTIDAVVDERTLREIYLACFEGAIKKVQPWTVMCAYNSVNGDLCSENRRLLTDILKEEWGHEGFVMSDWGAVNDRVKGLAAGLELEMPFTDGAGDRQLVAAVKEGKLAEEVLDQAVTRLLTVIFKAADNQKRNATYDREAHHALAREAARESMVLLKNENNILPLKKQGRLAIMGAFAKKPRFQGGGSSHINATKIENAFDEIAREAGPDMRIAYAAGYQLDHDLVDEKLLAEAQAVAAQSDTVVIFAGLPDRYECEGYDRQHLRIPANQEKLIEAVAGAPKNVVVVLMNGAPVEMPWLDTVQGLLEAYLGGQALGGAVADLLFGSANPCGKLAETFPRKLSDNPSFLNYPGEGDTVAYREGIFVGYRYYDTKEIEPLFPFGYGLSYTDFEYSDLRVNKKAISDQEELKVSVKVKNTGKIAGKEIVQLYVRDLESSVIRPVKELKAFEKIELDPGEAKEVSFTLNKRSFAYYNVALQDWHVETGDFEILVGKSSQEIILRETVTVTSAVAIRKRYHRNSTIGDLRSHPAGMKAAERIIGLLSTDGKGMSALKDEPKMLVEVLENYPLRNAVSSSGGMFTEAMLEQLLKDLNEGL